MDKIESLFNEYEKEEKKICVKIKKRQITENEGLREFAKLDNWFGRQMDRLDPFWQDEENFGLDYL